MEEKFATLKHVLKKASRPNSYLIEAATDFSELVANSFVIVDQTEFIKELYNYGNRTMVLLIALPPGTGKTMLLTMFTNFIDYSQDPGDKFNTFKTPFAGGSAN